MHDSDEEEAGSVLGLQEYQKWMELWEGMMEQYCPGRSSVFDLVLKLIRFTMKGHRLSVLDVGSGAGSFTARILDAFPHAAVCAVDRSSRNLHIGDTLHRAEGASRVTWIQADVNDTDWASALPTEPFDVVLM
ncbi:MAG: class I SAM-dependent methyltransferase, partial [Armatimonadota bacterium]|nr:class I SAM-dependent methyltransferase [Armatimonadota bacterium]